ncbi:MAG: glycosyltransferase family 4 protein [Lentisphaerae bacterium]|nr:glycosyltransferase family 4 protein [Lentisphaerota bacterium]
MAKILFISPQPFFQWRGSPIRVAFNVQALAELGHEVHLLTLPIGERKEIPGVRVIRVPNLFLRRDIPIGPSFWKAAFDVLLLLKGLSLGFRHRYDVVHGVEETGAVALFIARCTGGKAVFEKHSDPAAYKKGAMINLVLSLYRHIEAMAARNAEAVIGTGPGLAEQARAMNPRGPVYCIHDIPSSLCEADPASVPGIRQRLLDGGGEGPIVLYVGSFAVYQGVDLVFGAIPGVLAARPDTRFVIVGGTPDEIRERKAKLAECGADRAVLFPGKIPPDELPGYLAAADVLLSPRIAGTNTPLKVLDYLKAGGAIVATDHDAHRQILDESSAVLVEPSTAGIAEGILLLLGDEDRRHRLASRAVSLHAERYTYSAFKRSLEECYEGLSLKDRDDTRAP